MNLRLALSFAALLNSAWSSKEGESLVTKQFHFKEDVSGKLKKIISYANDLIFVLLFSSVLPNFPSIEQCHRTRQYRCVDVGA